MLTALGRQKLAVLLGKGAFESPVLLGLVVLIVFNPVGEVLLGDPVLRVVVRVAVGDPAPQLLGPLVVGIL